MRVLGVTTCDLNVPAGFEVCEDETGETTASFGVREVPWAILLDPTGATLASQALQGPVDFDALIRKPDGPAATGDGSVSDAGTDGAQDLAAGAAAPELVVSSWRNSEPLTLASLKGSVVLLDFMGYW